LVREKKADDSAKMTDLYVMQRSDNLGILKVGRSSNAERRAREIQGCHCFTVQVVALIPGAGHLELDAHRVLSEFRMDPGREWFRCSLSRVLAAIAVVTNDKPQQRSRSPSREPSPYCEPEEPDLLSERSGLSVGVSDDDPPISRELARQMRQEVETGKSARGRTLSEEEIGQRLAKLRRRIMFLPIRFRQAELARLSELVEGAPDVAEEGTSGDHSHASGSISKQYARQLRKELHDGATTKGRPLTDEQAELHIAKLRRRMLIIPARYRQAELARIQQLEYRRRSA
jgi:hypothetical protein